MQHHMPKHKHQRRDGDRQLPIFSAHVPDLPPDLLRLNRCANQPQAGDCAAFQRSQAVESAVGVSQLHCGSGTTNEKGVTYPLNLFSGLQSS